MRFYLAGPFFNPEQTSVMEKIEGFAMEIGLGCYSPRLENFCPPDAPEDSRIRAFANNVKQLGKFSNDFILARIDDFDPGTIFEIGCAYGSYEGAPVYAFTTVEGRGLNLMLAQSCVGFLQGLPSVYAFLRDMHEHRNDEEAKKWLKTII